MTVANDLKTLFQLQALQNLSPGAASISNDNSTNSTNFLPYIVMELAALGVNPKSTATTSTASLPTTTLPQRITTLPSSNQTSTTPSLPAATGGFGYKSYNDMTFGIFTKSYESKYDDIINEMGKKYNVDPKLLKCIIKQESDFNSNSLSSAGAAGLMQQMPANAQEYNVTDRFDPSQSIAAGAQEIKKNLKRYNGNLSLALAAYNAGPGNVDKYGGVPPFSETQNYVKQIFKTYYGSSNLSTSFS